ncbi:transglutaminaseTgpA domain-containing protein [uncultured Microbacterium sp.]|uniref:transglutaminase family protein n=1 Tax=uncultured Microbacterium sp. TaxID=191216 RepID=UPI0035CA905B
MSSSEAAASRRPAELALTIGVFVALFAAMMPLIRVVSPSWWVLGTVVLTGAVLAAGFVARRFRLPAIAVTLIELGVWVVLLTLLYLRDTALLGILPTPESVRTVPALISTATDAIVLGSAPLEPITALSFIIVGSMGLLAIAIDHVVLTARMPLLAAVGLIAISLIPSIAVPGPLDVTAFVLLAVAILFMLRVETRSREHQRARAAAAEQGVEPAVNGVSATALGIGAVAVIIAIVATPLLPPPVASAIGGPGAGTAIDPTLQLGDDLRRPREIEVLTVRSSARSVPYLRAATLSKFDGAVWSPDQPSSVPLGSDASFGPITVDPGIRIDEYTTTVEVKNLNSAWLPVAFPAVAVDGLDGAWAAVPTNRTVIAQGASTQGQTYDVITQVARPTLEQVRAHSAASQTLEAGVQDDTLALPADLPPIIDQLATQVTEGKTTDYDKLVALQTWFRSPAFRYSLDAPVESGFDGSGADAVARFLDVRAGYCVHFASAFALMARSLGMPTRIVVGYLPGSNTNASIDDKTVYSVMSGQLHAWPEVYFDGIGWIPFEPTNSLGSPTSFAPGSVTTGATDSTAAPTTGDAATPTPTISDSIVDPTQRTGDSAASSTSTGVDPMPAITAVLGILLALAIPGLIRELRRRQLLAAARAGDAAAAWTSVQDAAIDLGIPVPASESARALGTRLVEVHGAPAEPMTVLIGGIERASYAPGGRHGFWQGEGMADAATAVRAGLLASADRPRRLLAVVAPRSLIVRPGSAYAGSGSESGTRARAR